MIIFHCKSQTLLVGNLQRSEVSVDFVFGSDALSDHLKVQLAHAPKHRLPCLRIKGDAQPWVLALQLRECALQPFLRTLKGEY